MERSTPPPGSPTAVDARPTVRDFEARLFVVSCPVDLARHGTIDPKGHALIRQLDERTSTLSGAHLRRLLVPMRSEQRRSPSRPVFQIVTPCTFVSDDELYFRQLSAFLHSREAALPGVLICGRFPVHVWPRPLMRSFESHDVDRPLVLRRGEPSFYVHFEVADPRRRVQRVPAELTLLERHIAGLTGVTNYVKGTFELFTALGRRPRALLREREP